MNFLKLMLLMLIVTNSSFGEELLSDNNVLIGTTTSSAMDALQVAGDFAEWHNGYSINSVEALSISPAETIQLGDIATIHLRTGEITILKLPADEIRRQSAKLFWEAWEGYFTSRIKTEKNSDLELMSKKLKYLVRKASIKKAEAKEANWSMTVKLYDLLMALVGLFGIMLMNFARRWL